MMNNSVTVPRSYFVKTAKNDYNSPLRALVREFLQNSRDAGASFIKFNFSKNSEDKVVLVVEDNGCGMSSETITGKLMALGETSKGAESTGGFGVAKILLFFAHERYQIETRNLLVRGEGGCYGIEQVSSQYDGVRAEIVLAKEILDTEYSCRQGDIDRIANLFRKEIQKSYLPKLEIFVQDELVSADLKQGRTVEQLATGMTLHKRNLEYSVDLAYVRVRGLHMFEVYVEAAKFQLILELDGYSTDYLTTNRDGLKGTYRDKLSEVCRSYCLNSAKGNKSTVNLYRGKSSRYSEGVVDTVLEDLNAKISEVVNGEVDKSVLASAFAEAKIKAPEISEKLKRLETETFEQIFNGTVWKPWTVKDLELEHHYFVETIGNIRKLPTKWEPQNFKPSQVMLLELWSKIVGMVLVDADFVKKEFNVGFVLDDGSNGSEVLANYREREDGSFLFLLNPRKYGDENRLPIRRSRRLELINWLLSLAIHEVTHAAGNSYHNEYFIGAEAAIKRKCYSRIKAYLKL